MYYAILGTKVAACRKAKVGHSTIEFHLPNDPDFMAQAETAKAYAIDLLHARAMQRAIEGDCEPVFWQGIEVGHTRKFDSRLQIEMLRAHMPDKFKTPGSGGDVNIKDSNVFVLTEEQRARLMQANRERIMALPDSYLDAEFEKIEDTPAAGDYETQSNQNRTNTNEL